MGKLIITVSMTVDGLTDVSEWFVADGEHDRASRTLLADAAGMLVGRKTYEGFAGFWPTQEGPWADVLNPMPKYVVSRTLTGSLDWNATVIGGDPATDVARLKDELDSDLVLSGCGELASTLLEHGLVDEITFWLHPVVWGDGTRPFSGTRVQLDAVDSTTYDSGVTRLRCRPAGSAA